jgi:hypothetical protein
MSQLIDHKIGYVDRFEIPESCDLQCMERLRGLSLNSLFRVLWLFGRYLSGLPLRSGHARHKPDQEEAGQMIEVTVAAMANWPSGANQRIQAAVEAAATTNHRNALAAFRTYLNADSEAPDLAYIRAACERLLRDACVRQGVRLPGLTSPRQMELTFG